MSAFKEKYINPFTDYGFMRLFEEEPNKNLLLNFLNELLYEEEDDVQNFNDFIPESTPKRVLLIKVKAF